MRKLGTATALVLTALVVNPVSAHAGLVDGDITNRLPAGFTVKIASYGTGQKPLCDNWNADDMTCTRFWLPSGKADGQIGLGSNFDTDGFTVENTGYFVKKDGKYTYVTRNRWTKIPNFSNVNCYNETGRGPVCAY